MAASGVGDAVFFGPEAEFFIFDSVKFGTGPNYGIYQIDSMEGPQASLKDYPEGNMGHRPTVKGGYFPSRRWTARATSGPNALDHG